MGQGPATDTDTGTDISSGDRLPCSGHDQVPRDLIYPQHVSHGTPHFRGLKLPTTYLPWAQVRPGYIRPTYIWTTVQTVGMAAALREFVRLLMRSTLIASPFSGWHVMVSSMSIRVIRVIWKPRGLRYGIYMTI